VLPHGIILVLGIYKNQLAMFADIDLFAGDLTSDGGISVKIKSLFSVLPKREFFRSFSLKISVSLKKVL